MLLDQFSADQPQFDAAFSPFLEHFRRDRRIMVARALFFHILARAFRQAPLVLFNECARRAKRSAFYKTIHHLALQQQPDAALRLALKLLLDFSAHPFEIAAVDAKRDGKIRIYIWIARLFDFLER